MKTKTFTAALASLLIVGGSAFAADSAHDGYYRAFYGTSTAQSADMSGKAAYGTPTGASAWSGHEAYARAFQGTSGTPQMDQRVQGTGRSSADGLAAYSHAFGGD